MKMKLLVFGASGLVGSNIVKQLKKDFSIILPTHKQVDITDFLQIDKIIQSSKPDLILNAAGLTDIEEAEKNPQLAYSLNAKPSEHITRSLKKKQTPYYYISTDAVFGDSMDNVPYDEANSLIPISTYAKSKAKGEEITLKESSLNCVIRITLPYAPNFKGKSDLVRSTMDALKNKRIYNGIYDQIINPISVDDVVYGIKKILSKQASGIYHIAARNYMSNYDFVTLIADAFLLDKKYINKINLLYFLKDKRAFRSYYCALGVKRFQKDFGFLPTIEESLEQFKKKYFN